jgi:hypothetical protein
VTQGAGGRRRRCRAALGRGQGSHPARAAAGAAGRPHCGERRLAPGGTERCGGLPRPKRRMAAEKRCRRQRVATALRGGRAGRAHRRARDGAAHSAASDRLGPPSSALGPAGWGFTQTAMRARANANARALWPSALRASTLVGPARSPVRAASTIPTLWMGAGQPCCRFASAHLAPASERRSEAGCDNGPAGPAGNGVGVWWVVGRQGGPAGQAGRYGQLGGNDRWRGPQEGRTAARRAVLSTGRGSAASRDRGRARHVASGSRRAAPGPRGRTVSPRRPSRSSAARTALAADGGRPTGNACDRLAVGWQVGPPWRAAAGLGALAIERRSLAMHCTRNLSASRGAGSVGGPRGGRRHHAVLLRAWNAGPCTLTRRRGAGVSRLARALASLHRREASTLTPNARNADAEG